MSPLKNPNQSEPIIKSNHGGRKVSSQDFIEAENKLLFALNDFSNLLYHAGDRKAGSVCMDMLRQIFALAESRVEKLRDIEAFDRSMGN